MCRHLYPAQRRGAGDQRRAHLRPQGVQAEKGNHAARGKSSAGSHPAIKLLPLQFCKGSALFRLIKPNNVDEHSIYVEVELEISCNVYEKRELVIIQDLYSPSECLNINQKNITVMQDKRNVKDKSIIKEKMMIPELRNTQICNSEITPKIIKQSIYNDKIMYECELDVKFMYFSSVTNRVDVKLQTIPFNANLDCQGISQSSNLNTKIEIITQDFVIMPDESIETNIELEISVDVSKMMEVRVIDNVEVAENNNENVYSIVVYFVKPGDTLWKIAKRFKSTIRAISSVNGIEDENKINVGQQLFIPKFV